MNTTRWPVTMMVGALLLSGGCRIAEVVNTCVERPDDCPPCSSDDDCLFGGNSCVETVYCIHHETELAVVMIGCSDALEYRWPDDDECRCVDEACRWIEE